MFSVPEGLAAVVSMEPVYSGYRYIWMNGVRRTSNVGTVPLFQAIDAKPGSTFSIPVTKDWERYDVYVTALVFRGGSAPSISSPRPYQTFASSHIPWST